MDPKERSRLVKARGLAKSSLTRMLNFVSSFKNDSDINAINTRLEDMPKIRDKFDDAQERLELDDELEDHTEVRTTFETMYYDVLTKMKTLTNRDLEKQAALSSTCSLNPKKEFKLPTIKLPTFGGDVIEFRHFYDTFTSLVIHNETLDDIQRYHYLLSSLTGEAQKLIQNLPVTGTNFKIAWQTITDRYNNKKLIAAAHIKNLLNLPLVNKESHVQLRTLIDHVNSNLNAILALDIKTPLHEILISQLILEKLDEATRKQWELDSSNSEFTRLKELCSYLENRCQALELIQSNQPLKPNDTHHTYRNSVPKPVNLVRQSYMSTRVECSFCSGMHPLFKCTDFAGSTVLQRLEFVRQRKLCSNCLRSGHNVGQCTSRTCYTCGLKHHTLLHYEGNSIGGHKNSEPSNFYNSPKQDNAAAYCSLRVNPKTQVLLSTALIKVQDEDGNMQICRALLDSCSQVNFITTACVERLKLKRQRNRTPIQGISNLGAESKFSTTVQMHSMCSDYRVELNCSVLPRIAGHLPGEYINYQHWGIPETLTLADSAFNQPDRIDILIGADIFFHLLRPERMERDGNYPVLQNTKLGWILAGRFESLSSSTSPSTPPATFFVTGNTTLESQLQRFWELEELSQPPKSKDEEECEWHFLQNTTRDSTGRFTVRLPLREDPAELGDSRQMAYSRLLQLERRLSRNQELKEEYVHFMNDYEDRGHMKKIDTSIENDVSTYYLPHHPVFKESSSTTKTRVVFDASAPTTSGRSLNHILRVGPTIQQDIWSIIARFRTHQVVFTSDIRQMYRQINVSSSDCRLQRILWRRCPEEAVEEYQLNTVTYGTASAPFLATRCLQELATNEVHKYPKAAEILCRDFYVDDCISGAETVEEGLEIQTQLITLLKSGGFELRKWCSNRTELLMSVPPEHRETQLPLQLDNNENVRTLGLLWDPASDQLQIANGTSLENAESINHSITKRRILGIVSSTFDPLGLISPVIITCKVFLQQLWQLNLDWDQCLPEKMAKQWQSIHNELLHVNQIRIDRLVLLRRVTAIQLHGFSDASETGYGSCIYLRSETDSGECSASLLCAKSKVAPLKRVSLPRLELCGALLLARLLKKISCILNLPIQSTHLWTDSTIVLAWIAASPTRWKTFVANRVSEIQSKTSTSDWKHVSSVDNPADIISRGATPGALKSNTLWWNGPSWLKKPSSSWPISKLSSTVSPIPEQRKQISLVTVQSTDFMEHFSKLLRLQRVIAYCVRFAANSRRSFKDRQFGILSPDELRYALITCIKIAQLSMYQEEIIALNSTGTISKGSKLKPLTPFICGEGLLRVGGRLHHAHSPLSQKHQIILPPKHHLTRLIVEQEHKRMLHAGPQLLLASLRQHYWIVNGKSVVRNIIHSCVVCFRLKAKHAEQLMGQLPSCRVTPANPFVSCGTDYAGPLYIKSGSKRSNTKLKCYISIFVCLSTRAIHLEVVSDLTTAAFLAAMKRFISRRGKPTHIFSDNGRTFVGADKELRQLFNSDSYQQEVGDFSSTEGIHWHFNPPAAPHFGGIWEAGVKSFKYHLRRVMGTSFLTFEELTTLTAQIEACLNSRPLVPLSSDSDDPIALTPGHFLIGRPITSLPEPDRSNVHLGLLSRWQRIQQQLQVFWKAWSTDYLSHLQQKAKWSSHHRNVQPGTVVIVKDDTSSPLHWKLAVIDRVHPGSDGNVRVATIRTAKGTFRRPITKLCPLPAFDAIVSKG